MKGSWRWERPGEAIGEGVASAATEGEGSGLKGSSREVEAWHREESFRKAIGGSTAHCGRRCQHFGDGSTMR